MEFLNRDRRTHGATETQEYSIWCDIKKRCFNTKHVSYRYYGGRGITLSDSWHNFSSFLRDMGLRPSPKHTIERIDNDKNYEAGNCRWATYSEQARNKSNTPFITAFGRTDTIIGWAELIGVSNKTIAARLRRGLSPDDALSTTKFKSGPKKLPIQSSLALDPESL